MMANLQKTLPQEGTTLGGESLRASTSVGACCPTYSGGGKACHDEGGCATGSGKPVEPRCASAGSTRSALVSDCEAAGPKGKVRRKRKSRGVSSREGKGGLTSSSDTDAPPEKVVVVSDSASAAEEMPPPKGRPARGKGAPSPAPSSASMSVASLDGRTTEEEEGGLRDPALVIGRAMKTVKSYAATSAKTKAAGRRLREVVSRVSKVLPSVASANDQVVQLMAENLRLRAQLQAQQRPDGKVAATKRVAATRSPALPRAAGSRTPPASVPAVSPLVSGVPRGPCPSAAAGDPWPVLPPSRAVQRRSRLPSPRSREATAVERQQGSAGPRIVGLPEPNCYSLDEIIDRTVQAVMERLGGGLAALEAKRIVAGDAERPASTHAAVSGAAVTRSTPVQAPATRAGPGRDRAKRGGGANAKCTSQAPQPRPLPPPPSNMDEGWNVVARRGAKRAVPTAPQVGGAPATAASQAAPQQGRAPVAAKKKKTKKKSTRAPRSAAVVLTLLPAAEAKGVSYGDVVSRACAAIDLDEIGAGEGLRCRLTANGAKLLECPGADSSGIAERLAAKLRTVLPEEEVRVHRPVKMAELRVTGLDDCTTKDEVAAAIAARGNCALENITVGELRLGYTGAGSVWVRCPVEAATSLAAPPPGRPSGEPGRLRVGWIAARVRLLEPRAWRCLRCFSTGHCLAKCASAVDRSGLCFRCGQPGHKAAVCSAAPHCLLCAAAGRKADHRAGGKACPPASKNAERNRRRQAKRRQKKRLAGGAPAGTLSPAEAFAPDSGGNGVGEGAMDVVQS